MIADADLTTRRLEGLTALRADAPSVNGSSFDERWEFTMVPQFVSADQVLERIRADYLEMPGLRVSTAQARRLWGLEPVVCDRALEMLQERQFLKRLTDGTFVRVHSR